MGKGADLFDRGHGGVARESGQQRAMRRRPGPYYEIEYYLTPLETVAKVTRQMDLRYIAGNNNISRAFIDYAQPLVGKFPVVGS